MNYLLENYTFAVVKREKFSLESILNRIFHTFKYNLIALLTVQRKYRMKK
jgi:hypothetical protein